MTGIIVLCRYNSSRLPGKILKPIKGKEILSYILERLAVLEDKYPIVVCTSEEPTDDPIVQFCKQQNINFFRGSLNNVAKRFLDCAVTNNFSNAVRINGDNLFLDAHVIERMIQKLESEELNFLSNVKDRTFPKGMSVEIVNTRYYQKQYPNFSEDDLEHVMTFFYRTPLEKIDFVFNDTSVARDINLAIDTSEDFEKAKKILDIMDKPHVNYGFKEIIALFDKIEDGKH